MGLTRALHTIAMNKFTSLPVWQQYAFVAAWVLPWALFGILATDVLPESWRFQAWPAGIRSISIVLFCVFMVADVLFSVWYLFRHSHDDTTA
jgi:hypothetical protein